MDITKELIEKLEKVKIVVMDVDGTLTDGAMYYTDEGELMKRFSTRDGMGVSLLHQKGFQTAILTSEDSQIAISRAKKLKIEKVIIGSTNKVHDLELLVKEMSIEFSNIAYIGDDVNDFDAIRLVGFSACPSDAVKQIKQIVDYICKAPGGNGAVRELADLIIEARNLY